MTEKTRKYCNW